MLQLKIDLLDLTEEDLRTGNSLIADKLEQVVGNNALGINLPLLQENFYGGSGNSTLTYWTPDGVPHLGRNFAWNLLGNWDSVHSAHLLRRTQKMLESRLELPEPSMDWQ